ncbi:FAD/FMN-containing dehydrogenase [Fictibacillus enclensis]|uniref:FAD-binding protein n=1 Tax=Fictibacillus enclensis TaxID=1017270 RepID=A0A0V8JC99_9BACL|nr:FAD-binding oxidoreductase [Fictibacillus enclensis]KSU84627.1 FAD-binding protein [Fictibacillus enclensis]SCB82675.1 FAD/FMN-containing dehydrogenase [Fictibacillus enclensis]
MSRTRLTGKIVVPGSPSYRKDRQNLNLSIQKYPCIIVFCQNRCDVKNALKWARKQRTPFRVRSGRHSYENFSLVNRGLIIDVSEMKDIVYHPEQQMAYIQAGAELGMVYQQLWDNRVTIPAGTSYNVGLSGLALGGGIGMLTRAYGLTCDSIEEIEIVVPCEKHGAKIICASQTKNCDLFWACCGGGGGNFGIVTAFKFKVYPVANVSIFSITWNWEDFHASYNSWQNWAPFTDSRLTSQIELFASGTTTASGEFLGSPKELEELIKPLLETGTPLNVMIQSIPYIEAVSFFNSPAGNLPAPFKRSGSFVYEPLPDKAIETMKQFLENAPNQQTTIWQQALGGAVKEYAPKETAFFHRKAMIAQEYNTSWTCKDQKHENICWVEGIRNALKPYTKGDYVNWPDNAIKNWPCAYYGSNYKRLRKVKTEYDPYNVFCFSQSIRPYPPNGHYWPL